ncbi:MAG: TonB-dependent receptor [bacterium]|nr:TonB-dependent receptor [bacterium]
MKGLKSLSGVVFLGGLLWLCFFFPHLQADEIEDIVEMSLEDLLNVEVVTASRKAQKISDAPATVISISANQIKKNGWRDLKDLFRALPGVDLSYDTTGEVRTLVVMRGIPGNQKIAILQDGRRYSPTTGERFVYGHNIPLIFYKRVEIVYGPASALYGPDAYAGVINLITKDGGDIDGVEVGAGYVDTGAWTGDFLFGKKFGDDLELSMGFRAYSGEDFKLHEEYEDYAVVNQYNLGGVESIYPIRNWNMFFKMNCKNFTFSGDWQHYLETNAPATIPTNYAYVEDNLWGHDLRHLNVAYKKKVNPDLTITAEVNFGDYKLAPASNFTIFQDTELAVIGPSYKYAMSSYLKGVLQADWQVNKKIFVIAGAFYEDVHSFPKTKNLDNGPFRLNGDLVDDMTEPPFSLVDPDGQVFGVVGLNDPLFGERNYENYGLFLQSQVKLTDDLTLTVGGRYDYSSLYKETINPRVGVVYKPGKKLSIKALYGTAYIQPSNYYRWENFANPFILHIPNEDIKPEKVTSFSLSGTYYFTGNLSVRAEIFRNDLKDIIRQAIVGPSFNQGQMYYNPYRTLMGWDPDVDWVEINTNLGDMYTRGFELELNYKYKNFLANLSYSYLDGKDKENDHHLSKVSPHKVNATFNYTFKKMSAALTLRYYSEVLTMRSNSMYGDTGDGSYAFDGSLIAYMNLVYDVSKRFTLNLSVDNIFDTKHYGAGPFGESGWVQYRSPQALRKIHLGVRYKL